MKKIEIGSWLALCFVQAYLQAQSLGGAGTVTGTVTDPSGAVVANAEIVIRNPISGYRQNTTTDKSGAFRLNNIPPNNYHIFVTVSGFATADQDLDVRSSVPMDLPIRLALRGDVQTVTVEAAGALVENDPSDHTDVDRSIFSRLPQFNPGAGLSNIITYSTGGVAADANGFFHPLGDHAQVTFVIDGQPISDQQSKIFSTQLPPNAIQSLELITGSPDAEFGDKSSLIATAVSRSGLGATRMFGNIDANAGSFGTWGGNAALGFGTPRFGEFFSVDGIRSGRFLDTPEFRPVHAIGNNERIFNRFDYQPSGQDALHLNLFAARNWFQVPNSYDQLGQDQKQRVLTWNIAPGYQHTFNARTLLTINPFVRRDQVNYHPSADNTNDAPYTQSQVRFLTNYGVKADVSYVAGRHDIKVGTQLTQTRLSESFQFGITDPANNPICFDANGDPVLNPALTDPSRCSAVNPGYTANRNLQPGIVPYDLTRGGTLFRFHGNANISQYAFYIQDRIKFGNLTVDAGLRDDQYNGLTSQNSIQPRLGLSYLFSATGTVVRAAYSRTFETPFNENLILSSATGGGGLAENVFGSKSSPIRPGQRNQFNTGFQQSIGKLLIVDTDYFWKYTHNAYDFSVLLNTNIAFPISWHNSKLDGVSARVSTVNIHGFQAFMTLGHTRARYFGPENGGLIPQGGLPTTVFRIDHDQAFQQTTNLRYQRPNNGAYFSFVWRYDSGLVSASVSDVAAALALSPVQQSAIGFFCGNTFATIDNPIAACDAGGGAARIRIPKEGTQNDDHNPSRVAPRHLLDLAVGTDNLLRSDDQRRVRVQFSITNLTNQVALYNFLSTFSGTHFVSPRTYQAVIGYTF